MSPLLVLCALLLILGCGPAGQRPDVVLIVIDTLRVDHLPFYGYEKETAPFLSRLAREAVVFDHAYSTSSWTSPATASLFTSLYPFQHGVTSGMVATRETGGNEGPLMINRIPESLRTLPEMMQAGGYRTFAITDNLNICEAEGFDQGFDRFANYNYYTADVVNNKLMEWRDEILSSSPYFLYLHYMDPHKPLNGREPLYRRAEDPRADDIAKYDSEIRYLDQRIERVFDAFGWGENTVVIVTADHGEGLWDHGLYEHGYQLYNELIRVPLLFYFPLEDRQGRRIEENVSLLDVYPTLEALVEGEQRGDGEGRSLLPLLRGGDEGERDRLLLAHLHRREKEDRDLTVRASIMGGWKYYACSAEGEALYDLEDDPGEREDRAASNEAMKEKLRSLYEAFEKSCPKVQPAFSRFGLDDQTYEKMRALGYAR